MSLLSKRYRMDRLHKAQARALALDLGSSGSADGNTDSAGRLFSPEWVGSPDNKIALVAAQPEEWDAVDAGGFPMWAKIEELLAAHSISPDACYRTSIVKTYETNLAVSAHLFHGRRWLSKELDIMQPAVTMLIGVTPTQVMLGNLHMGQVHGRAVHLTDQPVMKRSHTVVPCYNPLLLAGSNELRKAVQYDFSRVADVYHWQTYEMHRQ